MPISATEQRNNTLTDLLTGVVCLGLEIDVGEYIRKYSNGAYKDVVTVACDIGYTLIGSAGGPADNTYSTECGADGNWTDITHCERE